MATKGPECSCRQGHGDWGPSDSQGLRLSSTSPDLPKGMAGGHRECRGPATEAAWTCPGSVPHGPSGL